MPAFFNDRVKNLRNRQDKRRVLRAELLEERRVLAAAIDAGIWQDATLAEVQQYEGSSYISADEFDLMSLDVDQLAASLASAPDQGTAASDQPIISIPRPDGSLERFRFVYAPIYAAEFQEQFPEIRTYGGQGIDDPTATIRFDLTPHGFHASVLSPNGDYNINPYYHLSDTDFYASYFGSNYVGNFDFSGQSLGDDDLGLGDGGVDLGDTGSGDELAGFSASGDGTAPISSGAQLRVYRAAIAAGGEYTQFHGGTIADSQAAIVTSLNRVNGILEREFTVRLELIANNAEIAYTNPDTDPFSANIGVAINENRTNTANVIGNENFDIGHLFNSVRQGGLAYLRSVGIDSIKAGAVTGITPPLNDGFDLVVAHEMGHQFGSPHTFSGDSGACGPNISGQTAVEIGSGITIMSYAGLCGDDNVARSLSQYYHSLSQEIMLAHVDQRIPNVGSRQNTVNSIPTVETVEDKVIPANTPFVLEAQGADADGNESLTYSWEQFDVGPQKDVAAGDDGIGPIFRNYNPGPESTRYFPAIGSLVRNTLPFAEFLPTTNRELDFRVTVRDNNFGAGAFNTEDVRLTVVNTGEAFEVTSQNAGADWEGLSVQTVTWNVAGTDVAPISTEEVSLYMSLDGGFTYPLTIAENIPNSGSASFFVPNVDTTSARIMVRGADNVFFDINNANISIDAVPLTIDLGTQTSTFLEDDPAVSVAPGATISQAEQLEGLSVDVEIIGGLETGDRLGLAANSSATIINNEVYISGVAVASYRVVSSSRLEMQLTAAATQGNTQELIRSIGFVNTTDSPTAAPRNVEFVFGKSIVQSKDVLVQPVNDSPVLANVSLATISEDTSEPAGTLISDVFAGAFSDPDVGASQAGIAVVRNDADAAEGSWQYASDGGSWANIGSVDDFTNSLVLASNSSLRFVPAADYFGSPVPIMVRGLDDSYTGQFSSTSTGTRALLDTSHRLLNGAASASPTDISIDVLNINDPPVATVNQLIIQIDQEQAIDRVFSEDLFIDIDSTVLEWQLISANGRSLPGWMSFDQNTREISGTPRNRDVGEYNLLLRVSDPQEESAEIPVRVVVRNVNDAPFDLRISNTTVVEGSAPRLIGELFATDPDLGDQISWTVNDSRFRIQDDLLFLDRPLDFEVSDRVPIVLTATDNGSPVQSSDLQVDIMVTDLNEFTPDIQPVNLDIEEGTPAGTMVHDFDAPDGDTAQTVTFLMTSGDVSSFSIDANTGEVHLLEDVDYDVKQEYKVFVQARDDGSPSRSRTVQLLLNVEPINEFPPSIPVGQTFSVQENTPTGTLLGTVEASDLDGDALLFTLDDVPGEVGWLEIDADGNIRTTSQAEYDFESNSAPRFASVTVQEAVEPFRSTTGTLTINVTDVNDPPSSLETVEVKSLLSGIELPELTVGDQDPAPAYSYATTDSRFEVRDGKLALREGFYFRSGDVGNTEAMIQVTDVNDPSSSALLPLTISVLSNVSPWQNQQMFEDTDRNGAVTPNDVLQVINAINDGLAFENVLPIPRTSQQLSLADVDVNGDNQLTANDALLVVNMINAQGDGEGEFAAPPVESDKADLETNWFAAFSELEEEAKKRKASR